MVESCRIYTKHQIDKVEPLCPSPFPEKPWQVLGTYMLYSQSVDYLIVIEYFSLFIEIAELRKNKTATEVIRALKAIFARHGIPENVPSNNELPLNSADYTRLAKKWGF